MKRFLVCCLIFFGITAATATDARADSVTDTLSVYVGYFGGPYYSKSTHHWTELDDLYGGALDTYQVAYSYYSGRRVAVDSARGFYLSDFLRYAGIDVNSIASLDFYTKDHTSGAYRSFTKYSLLDAPRYYFPNITADEQTGELTAADGGGLWDGAVLVEAMMALEDSWEWDAQGTNFTNPGTGNRFRLLFGQLSPEEAMTSASAKYVYAVYVTFSGMPELTASEPKMPVKVGSDYSVTVNVAAEDSLLDEYVRENLLWSSNNTDVVEVDMYGRLRVKKAGSAVITASYGDSSVSVAITASDNADEGASGGAGGGGDSEGPASEADKGDFEAGAADTDAQNDGSKDGAEEVSYSENSAGVYILSPEMMARTKYAQQVNSVLRHGVSTDSADGGVANWRDGEMGEGAEALKLRLNAAVAGPVYACLAGIFAAGLIGSAVSFRAQISEAADKKRRGVTK